MKYIGVDNGIGTIGIVDNIHSNIYAVPVLRQLNYTKTKS